MLLITLDDAMHVLVKNGYLDPRLANEEGRYDLVRNELEQKCYMFGSENNEIRESRDKLDELTVSNICDAIRDGILGQWLLQIRIQLLGTFEMLIRKEEEHGGAKQDEMSD